MVQYISFDRIPEDKKEVSELKKERIGLFNLELNLKYENHEFEKPEKPKLTELGKKILGLEDY